MTDSATPARHQADHPVHPQIDPEALLDAEVVKYTRSGWTVVSRVPGTVVVAPPPIKTPILTFLFLTLITCGLFLLFWISFSARPKNIRWTLTVENGVVVKKRNLNF